MWLLLFLPFPLPLFPIMDCLSSDVVSAEISEKCIISTRKVMTSVGDSFMVAEITEMGEYWLWDKPLRDYLFREHTNHVDLDKAFYARVIKEGSEIRKAGCIEVVNSTLADKLLLNYLANQRKNSRRISSRVFKVKKK